MATELLMPKLGLTMTEGTIDEWKKKVGDTVLYSKYSGSEFKVDGKNLIIIRQSDILAIVE